MSSGSFWSDACQNAVDKSLQTLLDSTYASCSVTVAAYCVSALAGGTMFYRWRCMSEEDRRRVWLLYGWFCALMACGSCFGAVAWSSRMMTLVETLKARKTADLREYERFLFEARALDWVAAFCVTYAIELTCLCAAKLMVLDRMRVFLMVEGGITRMRWVLAGRIVMAVVVLGNAVGLAANAAAALHYLKAAETNRSAFACFIVNNSNDCNELRAQSVKNVQLAGSIVSVQRFSEVITLLFIVAAFTVVGLLCSRHFTLLFTRLRLLSANASSLVRTVKTLRWQQAGTTAVVFVAFLIRSVSSTLEALAFQMRAAEKQCR
jgi:hypothetical protein